MLNLAHVVIILFGHEKYSSSKVGHDRKSLRTTALSHGGQFDLDGKELAQELKNVPDLPSKSMSTLELFKFIQTKQLTETFKQSSSQRYILTQRLFEKGFLFAHQQFLKVM